MSTPSEPKETEKRKLDEPVAPNKKQATLSLRKLNKMKLPELKQMCKESGKKVTGTKIDLIIRISEVPLPWSCEVCPCHDISDAKNEKDALDAAENCCKYCDAEMMKKAEEEAKKKKAEKKKPQKKKPKKKKESDDDDDDDDDDDEDYL